MATERRALEPRIFCKRSLEDASRKEHEKWKATTLADTNRKVQRLLGTKPVDGLDSDGSIGPLIILLPLSSLRRYGPALRRRARLCASPLPALTLQPRLPLRSWLALHILLPWLRILLALLLIGSALLVRLPALARTRLRVLRRWSIRLSRRCLLAGPIALSLPSRLLILLTLPPGLLPLSAWCVRRALLAGRTLQARLLAAPLVDQLPAGALRRKGLLHEGAIACRFLGRDTQRHGRQTAWAGADGKSRRRARQRSEPRAAGAEQFDLPDPAIGIGIKFDRNVAGAAGWHLDQSSGATNAERRCRRHDLHVAGLGDKARDECRTAAHDVEQRRVLAAARFKQKIADCECRAWAMWSRHQT